MWRFRDARAATLAACSRSESAAAPLYPVVAIFINVLSR